MQVADDEHKQRQIQLESISFDGFSVTWTANPAINVPNCTIPSFGQEKLPFIDDCPNWASRVHSITSSTQSNIDGVDIVLPNPVLPPGLFYLADPSQNYAAYRQEHQRIPRYSVSPPAHRACQTGTTASFQLPSDVSLSANSHPFFPSTF
jgi:hypothetical protein